MTERAIEATPLVMGGRECLRGHRVTIAQVVAELADGRGPRELANNMGWDEQTIRDALNELSMRLDK